MKNTSAFEANARKIRELHLKIHETFAVREKGSDELKAWEEATRDFHNQYNQLAFPGGLDRQLMRLKIHDPQAVEMAIRFLEVDPRFFRSGYIKNVITRRLKKAELAQAQISRLNAVIISMVHRDGRREFRGFSRLARAIQTPELIREITNLIGSPDESISRRAVFMMDIINS